MHEHPNMLLFIAHEQNRRMRADAKRSRLRRAVTDSRSLFRRHRASDDPAG